MLFQDYKFELNFRSLKPLLLRKTFFFYFVPALLLLQAVYSASAYVELKQNLHGAANEVKYRVALDLAHNIDNLPMIINTATKGGQYLATLNHYLHNNNYPLQVNAVTNAKPGKLSEQDILVQLDAINHSVWLIIAAEAPQLGDYLSSWPWVLAFLITLGFRYFNERQHLEMTQAKTTFIDPCRLYLDLHQKSLVDPASNSRVALANKPLCFYAALIEYCLKNPEKSLNPNKELPEDFDRLCKKYFSRLTELGHTIRKRPNFANNLEKTLSEIRAALDELYGDDFQVKEKVYPKKAIGEGSRSKAHNFALVELSPEIVKVIGY